MKSDHGTDRSHSVTVVTIRSDSSILHPPDNNIMMRDRGVTIGQRDAILGGNISASETVLGSILPRS